MLNLLSLFCAGTKLTRLEFNHVENIGVIVIIVLQDLVLLNPSPHRPPRYCPALPLLHQVDLLHHLSTVHVLFLPLVLLTVHVLSLLLLSLLLSNSPPSSSPISSDISSTTLLLSMSHISSPHPTSHNIQLSTRLETLIFTACSFLDYGALHR